MGRIEDDRRPPRGRLHDLERRRQFAIKLGHRRAPSLESEFWIRICARKTEVLCGLIVDNHNRSAKRKKFETGWNVSSATKNACGD
jgi:hypothetical protein